MGKDIAVKIIVFLSVWIVSYTLASAIASPFYGFGPFILSVALSVLAVYIWTKFLKIFGSYSENKRIKDIISRRDEGEELEEGEALDLLFSETPAAEKDFKEKDGIF